MTHEATELALYAINTGEDYHERLEIARSDKRFQAIKWAAYANKMARRYVREFATRGDEVFTPEMILMAAADIAEYYERHVAEMNAA